MEGISHRFDEDHSGAKFSHEYNSDDYKAIGIPVLELFTKYSDICTTRVSPGNYLFSLSILDRFRSSLGGLFSLMIVYHG